MSIRFKIYGLLALGMIFVSTSSRVAIAAEEPIPAELFNRMAKALDGRKVKNYLTLMGGGSRSSNSLR